MSIKTTKIVTHIILNEDTGELTNKDFREVQEYKKVRQGFRMVYKSYDEVLLQIVKSNLDLKIVTSIKDMFTYNIIEVGISAIDLSKKLNTSKQKVNKIIKTMVDYRLLKRVRRGVYRLNPYMFIPYKSEAELLQKEWNDIK